jgi:hypothetical protein
MVSGVAEAEVLEKEALEEEVLEEEALEEEVLEEEALEQEAAAEEEEPEEKEAEEKEEAELALVVVTGKQSGRGSGYTDCLSFLCNTKCRRSRCTSTGEAAGMWYTFFCLEPEEKAAEEKEEGPGNYRFCTLYFRRIRRSSCQGSLCRFACSLCRRSRSSRSRSRRHSCCRHEACHWGNESLPLKKSCRHRPSSVQPQSQGRMSLLVRHSVATAVRGLVLM